MDYDFERMSRYYTVRVELNEGEVVSAVPIHPEKLRAPFFGTSMAVELFEQKLALLKIAPVGTELNGVGLRKAANIYYVRFYEDEKIWDTTNEMLMWR